MPLKRQFVSKDPDPVLSFAPDIELKSRSIPQNPAVAAVKNNHITATERFSRPPYRYTEASLVKKLEELGIGRPSTYAPTISTIQNRGYVEKGTVDGVERQYTQLLLEGTQVKDKTLTERVGADKGKLVPTDIGMIVTDFLVNHFEHILDYNFTAHVEAEFDDIAEGKEDWTKMMKDFYKDFHPQVEDVQENADRESGERVLGTDPETGRQVSVRLGKFGPMVQIGTVDDEEKPLFASLTPDQQLTTITYEEAMDLFKLPKTLGEYKGEKVEVNNGRYGPYVKFGKKFVSLPKGVNPMSVELEDAVDLIKEKEKADAPIYSYQGLPVTKGKGRFGPFIKWNNMFINVNRKYDFEEKESKVGHYTSKVSKDSPIKQSFAITPYRDLDIKESSIPTSKVSEKDYEKLKEKSPEKSTVRARPTVNRPALGQANENDTLNEYKKEKAIIQNILLDKQIKEMSEKICDSPIKPKDVEAMKRINKENIKQDEDLSPMPKYTDTVETIKLADLLSKIIQVEAALFDFKEAFEEIKQEQKWQRLNSELHINKVYLKQEDIKDFMKISIHERNPFKAKSKGYSLNKIKDMGKLIAQSQEIWNTQIYKCVSLDSLAAEGFTLSMIDINAKGSVGLEDLVLFINMNSQKFYRSRDVVPLYKRFLKLEHKTLEKNLAEGILFPTFMDWVARQ